MNRRDRKDEGDLSPRNDSPLQRASFLEPGDLSPGDLTGIILAGGKSRRMGGRNKAFLELDGRPLVDIVIERMQSVCAELLIVAGDTSPYTKLGIPLVEDRFRGIGVLGGLHAGLEAASHELALIVGCDMPFLNPDLLRAFADWAAGYDVAVLRHAPAPPQSPPFHGGGVDAQIGGKCIPDQSPPLCGGDAPTRRSRAGLGGQFIEPLHGAYRRTCLPAIEAAIETGERRIVSFFPNVRVRYVTPAEISSIDPDLRSFRNVNTPEEWDGVQEEWQRQSTR